MTLEANFITLSTKKFSVSVIYIYIIYLVSGYTYDLTL